MVDNLSMYLPSEVEKKIAQKVKNLRLQYQYKRATLAERSGVPVATIKRFETTGKISLSSLLKIANALKCLDSFLNLFPGIEAKTLSDLEKAEKKIPKRGTI